MHTKITGVDKDHKLIALYSTWPIWIVAMNKVAELQMDGAILTTTGNDYGVLSGRISLGTIARRASALILGDT